MEMVTFYWPLGINVDVDDSFAVSFRDPPNISVLLNTWAVDFCCSKHQTNHQSLFSCTILCLLYCSLSHVPSHGTVSGVLAVKPRCQSAREQSEQSDKICMCIECPGPLPPQSHLQSEYLKEICVQDLS